jgi:hypothetical protein
VIATDGDREGEVIGRELLDYFEWTGNIDRLWLTACILFTDTPALNINNHIRICVSCGYPLSNKHSTPTGWVILPTLKLTKDGAI